MNFTQSILVQRSHIWYAQNIYLKVFYVFDQSYKVMWMKFHWSVIIKWMVIYNDIISFGYLFHVTQNIWTWFMTLFKILSGNTLQTPLLLNRKVNLSVCRLFVGKLYYYFRILSLWITSPYLYTFWMLEDKKSIWVNLLINFYI